MSEFLQAIILGIVQGATEFIPVSSSGHLVIVPWVFGWGPSSLLFDTVLHWGTLLSIVVIFWRDFLDMATAMLASIGRRSLADANARLGWLIVLGSVPAALSGLLFKDTLEALFASPMTAAFALLITAGILAGSEQLVRRRRDYRALDQLTLTDALAIGLAQAAALVPGISRSGATIAAGLARGIRRDHAARFSFLLGAPAFLGAGLLQLADALAVDPAAVRAELPYLVIGFVASALTGFVAIRFLLRYLRQHTLYIFAAYCLIVGLGILSLALIRG